MELGTNWATKEDLENKKTNQGSPASISVCRSSHFILYKATPCMHQSQMCWSLSSSCWWVRQLSYKENVFPSVFGCSLYRNLDLSHHSFRTKLCSLFQPHREDLTPISFKQCGLHMTTWKEKPTSTRTIEQKLRGLGWHRNSYLFY